MLLIRKIAIVLLLIFLVAPAVNGFSPKPSFEYNAAKCTRYCHNQGCQHFFKKLHQGGWMSEKFYALYCWNINALKQNWFGLSYQQMNIVLYVIAFPLACLLLTYTAFKK